MTFWLLLILGLITYIILQRSVANITRTPVWLLWLVMMTPAVVLIIWAEATPEDGGVPAWGAIALMTGCFILYLWLLYRGRTTPEEQAKTRVTAPELSSSLTPLKEQLRPIAPGEETQLRNCFNWSVYALHQLEYRPQAVICRGQLRTTPDRAYRTIRDNIEQKFGDRFLVVLQEGENQKPLFVLAPNPKQHTQSAESDPTEQPAIALGLFLITLFTSTTVGVELAGIESDRWQADPRLLLQGLPYACSLLGVLGIRELGRYAIARRHQLETSLPYFIPFPMFLGTLGAFLRIRSPIPNRKVLFDTSIVGPLLTLLVSFPLLLWGLSQSQLVPASEASGILNFQELIPTFSLLLSLCSALLLPGSLDPSQAIELQPVAIVGYLGIILSAFTLMPIGRLDGGQMVHAMFGRRTALAIGQISRILILLLALLHPELLLWAILLFLIPLRDSPALNDVSELDNKRDVLGLISLFLLALILLPVPQMLTQALS
ncbi:site-2 protease family protein [Phormidium yuhuli AB48]|uniref:Site-2 protease family protein n=1 Tax=Phormidium yuhuli AB48 TaxID=2940671 RepID=A0ABY5AT99_9CYAN|nr:site-2 protease family protein [Phormidium yuhuli]USR92255.1 site-2 protease family protein [Phormidium yuhuli AB48]